MTTSAARQKSLVRALLATSLVAGASLVGSVPGAAAQGCQGQAGTSALEQYCEAIPRGDGGRDRPGSSNSSGSSPSSPNAGSSSSGVSPSTSQALKSAGEDGAAVEQLAAGEPTRSSSKSGSKVAESEPTDQGEVKAERVESPADPSANPLKAATKAAGAGPVAGPEVVWSLVGLSAAGAAAAVLLRRRRSSLQPVDDTDAQE